MSDQPDCNDETAADETVTVDDVAVDNDTEQPQSGAPADDEQETAVDAFVAEDEDDAPADSQDGGSTPEPGE